MKKLAIVGATGLVGGAVLDVLKEECLLEKFDLHLIVSEKSAGRTLVFSNREYPLIKLDDNIFGIDFDYAIFLTDELISRVWIPKFVENGVIVIDNSSAFRLDNNIPLVVPEINLSSIKKEHKIIANPNCSTIQLVVALDRIRKLSKLNKVIVSSYQSVSGAGRDALIDLKKGTKNHFKMPIRDNFIAAIGGLMENGNYSEENKIIFETKKILNQNLDVFATAVRVPISFCHGESVYVEFEEEIEIADIKKALTCDYIKISEDLFYPIDCAGTNFIYVFRLRKINSSAIMFFVLADNLRRGAAYNAVKILHKICN